MPAHRERQQAVAGDQTPHVERRALPVAGRRGQDDEVIGGFGRQAIQRGLDASQAVPTESDAVADRGSKTVASRWPGG